MRAVYDEMVAFGAKMGKTPGARTIRRIYREPLTGAVSA